MPFASRLDFISLDELLHRCVSCTKQDFEEIILHSHQRLNSIRLYFRAISVAIAIANIVALISVMIQIKSGRPD